VRQHRSRRRGGEHLRQHAAEFTRPDPTRILDPRTVVSRRRSVCA
jgi:hypothetical protein